MQENSFNKMRSLFFFGLIIILAVAMLYIIRPFIYPIFWAAIISILFYSVYKKIFSALKMPGLSSFITILLIIIVLFLPLTVLITLLINQSFFLFQSVSQGDLINQVQGLGKWLQNNQVGPYLESIRTNWTQYAEEVARTISLFLFNNLRGLTEFSIKFIFQLFIMFYTLYFFLKDGPRMLRRLMHLSPLGDENEKLLYYRFTSTARATLKGTLVVGTVQGLLAGILFWITGIQGAFVWAVIMTVLSIVPALGSSIIWFPAGIIMLALGNIWQGLVILLGGILLVSTIDNFIRPILIGKDIQMHSLIALFSTLGGIFVFGISGFVIGPVIAALFLSVMTIYDHHFRKQLNDN